MVAEDSRRYPSDVFLGIKWASSPFREGHSKPAQGNDRASAPQARR